MITELIICILFLTVTILAVVLPIVGPIFAPGIFLGGL